MFSVTGIVELVVAMSREILLGTVLLISAAVVGGVLGKNPRSFPASLVAMWLGRVVLPLVRNQSLAFRTVVIFSNNAGVLCVLVVVGASRTVGAIMVGVIGFSLGMAVRLLSRIETHWHTPGSSSSPESKRRVRIGVALNLLEPPAILLAIGLCLGRSVHALSEYTCWSVFGIWIAPLLLISAFGEALWIGEGLAPSRSRSPASQPNTNSVQD
ncbi:MAG: hypothetical protein AABZ47_14315 [Planctomycetota bacterium]